MLLAKFNSKFVDIEKIYDRFTIIMILNIIIINKLNKLLQNNITFKKIGCL